MPRPVRLSRTQKKIAAGIGAALLVAAVHGHASPPHAPAGSPRARGGSNQALAKAMAAAAPYRWAGEQATCLDELWTRESGFRVTATNPSSGAYGIPQSLPAGKMAAAGRDWRTDAATQIRWGLSYIRAVYGTPCGAWAHETADGWY